MIAARDAAVKMLREFRKHGTLPNKSLDDLRKINDFPEREAALATQLFYGVLQNMLFCDFIVSCFSNVSVKKIEPQVLDILRISIYQIVFLDKIPHSAAVNEGVKLAKKLRKPNVDGYINAVLRKVANSVELNSLPQVKSDDEMQRLSIMYSHPKWLVRELLEVLELDGVETLLRMNNSSDLPVTAQVNTTKATADDVLSILLDEGVAAKKHEWLDNCIELRNPGKIDQLDSFRNGLFFIQDAASTLAVIAADPKPGSFVIDACASPGGKSFMSAMLMSNKGTILSCDITKRKLDLIIEGASRLGTSIVEPTVKDATIHDEKLSESADIVIADVPCSGLGVIRKKPDIRYKAFSDILPLSEIQKCILNNAASYVKPGGTLIYSTCTFLEKENEGVIFDFLSENQNFSPDSLDLPKLGCIKEGMITLWPHIHNTDGFFICKLKRKHL